MKKALKILGIAIIAATVFAGCDQGPTEVNAAVTYKQGTLNYELKGKKLTYVNTSYLTKTTAVTDTSKPELGTAETREDVAYKTVTTEYAFNDDDTNSYTETQTTVYLAGANGNFRTYINTPAGTTVKTTISWSGDGDLCGVIVDGLAGLTESVYVTNGTWSSFKKVESVSDSLTLEYAVNTTSSVSTTTGITYTTSDVTADANYAVTEKDTYKVTGNNTVNNSTFDSYYTFAPSSSGEKTVGEDDLDIVYINGDPYTVTDIE